jgi:hypothetical protein
MAVIFLRWEVEADAVGSSWSLGRDAVVGACVPGVDDYIVVVRCTT